MRWRGLDGSATESRDTEPDNGGGVNETVNRQQAMDTLDRKEWRRAPGMTKCKMTRLNDKLVDGARILDKRNLREDGEVEI